MGKVDNIVLVALGGFVAGLLLAPKSGKETRQDIMDKTNDLKVKASDGFGEIKKGASSVKDESADGVENVKGIAKDASVDAKRTANRLKDEAVTRGEAVSKKGQRTLEDVDHTR
jgi:gas vesicle protein